MLSSAKLGTCIGNDLLKPAVTDVNADRTGKVDLCIFKGVVFEAVAPGLPEGIIIVIVKVDRP